MTTLVSTAIDRVLRKFQQQDTPDILIADLSAGDTSLSYQGFVGVWGPGLTIQVGSERMIVTDNDATSKVATVVRGWDGTTAADHTAGDRITVRPRGDRGEVLNLVNDCLDDIFPDLFKVSTEEITYNTSIIGYEISAAAVMLLGVFARTDSSALLWEPIFDWEFIEDANASSFTTGKAIMLRASLPTGALFRVKYATPFSQVSTESEDLEADAGLADYMLDLPYHYALSRLLPAEEQLRSQIKAAGSHQRAQDVPGFLALRTGDWYWQRYLDRKASARKTLSFIHKSKIGTGYGS